MKKGLSVLLSLLMLLSVLPLSVFAADKDQTPFIILQGYSGPRLDNADTGEQVWGLDFSKVLDRVVKALPDIAGSAGDAFIGNITALVDIVGGILNETMEPVLCNPDGTSKHNVVPHITSAAQARVSALRANGEENMIAEKELVSMVEAERGAENVFIFHFDWRKGQVAYAKAIDEFIQEVKALTGAKQVDIFGLSHGGQCGASYLYYYGFKGDARKVILDAPAIGGTTMVGDPLTGVPLHLDYATILEFAELGIGTEEEFEWLIKYIGFRNLNAFVTELCERYIIDIIKNIPSIWDFCPLAVYEQAKKLRLDPIENAEIIAASDAFHYGAMKNMSTGLKAAQKAGTSIAVVTNYGHENVTGSNKNSDYIIDTFTSSGAYCAPFDSRFSADYQQKNTNCRDKGHLHISPERNLDASTAYLPDNTWFVSGQFHGMYVFDPYTVAFVKAFYFTDKIKDIFSDPQFPQFNSSQNPIDSLYIRFDNTAPGYHSAADKRLLIQNLSKEYDITVWRLQIGGADFTLTPAAAKRIAAGKSAYITLPEHLLTDCTSPFDITVVYTLYNRQMQLKSKMFSFTPLTESDAKQFSYLLSAAPLPTEITDLTEPEKTHEEPAPPEPENSSASGQTDSESVQKTDADIPQTAGQKTAGLPLMCIPPILTAALVFLACRRKRTESLL